MGRIPDCGFVKNFQETNLAIGFSQRVKFFIFSILNHHGHQQRYQAGKISQ